MLFAADVYEFESRNGHSFTCDPAEGLLQLPFAHVGRTLIAIDSSEPAPEEWRDVAAEAWLKNQGYSRLAILRQFGHEREAKYSTDYIRARVDPAPPQLCLGEFLHIHRCYEDDDFTPYEGRDFYFYDGVQSWVIAVTPVKPQAKSPSDAEV